MHRQRVRCSARCRSRGSRILAGGAGRRSVRSDAKVRCGTRVHPGRSCRKCLPAERIADTGLAVKQEEVAPEVAGFREQRMSRNPTVARRRGRVAGHRYRSPKRAIAVSDSFAGHGSTVSAACTACKQPDGALTTTTSPARRPEPRLLDPGSIVNDDGQRPARNLFGPTRRCFDACPPIVAPTAIAQARERPGVLRRPAQAPLQGQRRATARRPEQREGLLVGCPLIRILQVLLAWLSGEGGIRTLDRG